jgi:GrpB-like predicted nucleotidyltransferase (UPF0157 family)
LAVEIVVVEYDPTWPDQFARELEALQRALGEAAIAIEHIGSTSVPGLAAKPVIDILIGVARIELTPDQIAAVEALSYEFRGEAGIPGRLFFRKVPRTAHVHVVEHGGEIWRSHLLFRDYLRVHPAERDRYAALKRELAGVYREDRQTYTASKEPLIAELLESARRWAEGR